MKLHCTERIRQDQLDSVGGIPSLIFPIKALFINCSSASTRVICEEDVDQSAVLDRDDRGD